VETVTVGRATVFGAIIEAVERAEHSRAPVQKLADRLAGYLVYFALGASLLTLVITHNLRSSIAVIIVAGACGIAAGTPLAILGAIGRAARRGAIIKGGRFVELLAEVDTVVLDKTGTLTFGDPVVTRVFPAKGCTERIVLESAAVAERLSEHPLSKAILKKASSFSLTATDPDTFEYLPGKGIRCAIGHEQILVGNRTLLVDHGVSVSPDEGHVPAGTAVLVARGGLFLGFLHVEDRLRPEAAAAVRQLKQMGLEVVLLTGDSQADADSVGRLLSVDEVAADLLPHQKVAHIDEMVRAGRIVAMVGDGVNDAPALARAAVGVAMGSGTDVARQSADVLLIGNNLQEFAETVRLARRCRGIIVTNFAGTIVVDVIGVVLAAIGVLNPLLAAFIHVSSELAFIGNSARLIPSLTTLRGTPLEKAAQTFTAAAQ
jgi:heavy metal translocating P-type ATPase